jgi:hypothetical protein
VLERESKLYYSKYERLKNNNRNFVGAVMDKVDSVKKYKRELEEESRSESGIVPYFKK